MALTHMFSLVDAFSEVLWSMGVEIAIASFAAILYFRLSGWAGKARGAQKHGVARRGAVGPHAQRAAPEDVYYTPEHRLASQALQAGDLREAVAALMQAAEETPRSVPRQLGARLLSMVARSPSLKETTNALKPLTGRFQADALEGAMLEAMRTGDMIVCRDLHTLGNALDIPLGQKTLRVLAKAYCEDTAALRALVTGAPLPLWRPFAEAVLEACTFRQEVELAAEVFEKVDQADVAFLRAFVERLAAGGAARSRFGAQRDMLGYARMIRTHGKNKDLKAAVDAFEKVRNEHIPGPPLYNSILDSCVECQDLDRAITYFEQAKEAGSADTVSFNILMKGHLARGDFRAAEAILEELKKSGFSVTAASYNALLGFRVQSGDSQGAWRIVEEMRAAAIPIGAVTCSILLRSHSITGPEVSRVVSMMDEGQESFDDTLFTSLIDACFRTGSLGLLTKKREEYKARGGRTVLAAPMYGSMIKAYGQARDLEQVWTLWHDMISSEVKVTSITFGCMVEALVANGAAKEARTLVNQIWDDESQRHLVNTVIYSTILKGFSNSKEPKEVMALYGEMRVRGIQPNTITYNTILNAFAECAAMHEVPALLEDMQNSKPPVQPDLVTYSTLIKGFCSNGDLDRGLTILEEMTSAGEHAPDEVMYNSLLDGCAKEQRLDDALRLLDDMKARAVAPSNYTLSMLVKLMGRCRRLGQAFTLIESLSKEHGFRVNLQVYTCLIQACFRNRQLPKALALHDQILAEELRPDQKLYTALVQGCLQAGAMDQAVRMVRCAYNLPDCGASRSPQGTFPGVDARCLTELVAKLGGEGSQEVAALLAEVRACQSQAPAAHVGKGKGGSRGALWRQTPIAW